MTVDRACGLDNLKAYNRAARRELEKGGAQNVPVKALPATHSPYISQAKWPVLYACFFEGERLLVTCRCSQVRMLLCIEWSRTETLSTKISKYRQSQKIRSFQD
jgi:hypothetical protein